MIKISELHIYPIKSMAGISLQESELDHLGLKDDRRMMLIDSDGIYQTQRELPSLAKFGLSATEASWRVDYENHEHILAPFSKLKVNCEVWEKKASAFIAPAKTNEFFSKHLGQDLRLVCLGENEPIVIDNDSRASGQKMGFADGYPCLILSQESLDLLNNKLEDAIPMDRFRPNIVIAGCQPHEEDKWKNFEINAVRFVGVKPCKRCVMTTIDQKTLKQSKEPLKTLATYRQVDNYVHFGFNIYNENHGTIRVGDKLMAHEFLTANG